MTTPNHDVLIELLLADELSPVQRQQLRELVASNSLVENEVFEQMWLEPLLRDSFRSDTDAFVQRIEAAMDSDDRDAVQFTERLLDAWTQRSARRSKRLRTGAHDAQRPHASRTS